MSEEVFDSLVQEFLDKAAKVKCSAHEYRDGLRYAIEEVRTAIQASEEMDR